MNSSNDLSLTIENLRRAQNFISNPNNWGKGDYLITDMTGCNFQACAQGALRFVGVDLPAYKIAATMFDPDYEIPKEHEYLYAAMLSLDTGHNSVFAFNDAPETTHDQVMRLFDRAIYLAKADSIERECTASCTYQPRPELTESVY